MPVDVTVTNPDSSSATLVAGCRPPLQIRSAGDYAMSHLGIYNLTGIGRVVDLSGHERDLTDIQRRLRDE